MAIGSFGAWVTFLGFSASGLDGDGWFVLVAAAVAVALILWHNRRPAIWRLVLAALAGVVGLGVGIYDWSQIESIASEADDEFAQALADAVSPGWGLILCVLASVSLVASLVVHYLKFAGGSFEQVAAIPPDSHLPSQTEVERRDPADA